LDPPRDADLGNLLGAGEALSAGVARRGADLRPRRDRGGDAAAALLRERAARPAALAERSGSRRGAVRRGRGVGAGVHLLESRRRGGGSERSRLHAAAPACVWHGARDPAARRIVPRLPRRGLRYHPGRRGSRHLAAGRWGYCSTLMPLALMTSVQRRVSLRTKAANWSALSAPACAPCAASFSLTSGVLMARATSSRRA